MMKMVKRIGNILVVEGKARITNNNILFLETGQEGFDVNCLIPRSMEGKFFKIIVEETDGKDVDMTPPKQYYKD